MGDRDSALWQIVKTARAIRGARQHYENGGIVHGLAEDVFERLDQHARLSSHMSDSSWMMAGGRMDLELDENDGRAVGSRIQLKGKVLGVMLSVEEIVIERELPLRKTWETTGIPRLLVIGGYRMGFQITPRGTDCLLRIFIDYEIPASWLGRLLGPFYARWCVDRMLSDAIRHFSAGSAGQAQPG